MRSAPRAAGSLPVFVHVVLSLLVVWHLGGVILAAWSIPPTSPLVVDLAQWPPMQWYLDALYLDHDHQSFTNPGESHLIRYEVLDNRGSVIQQGEFPNKKEQWPRLRYHRYFMLADQAGLPLPDEAEQTRWERQYLEAYARQLLREYRDGESVRVQRVAALSALSGARPQRTEARRPGDVQDAAGGSAAPQRPGARGRRSARRRDD